jgi:galactokinase
MHSEAAFADLYGSSPAVVAFQRKRYAELARRFAARFPGSGDAALFSSPGRTEIGGNHTDHNGGRVLAAAVDLDIVAAACPTNDGVVVIESEGYAPIRVDTRDLSPRADERYTSAALVQGVCSRLADLGYRIGGLNACVDGRVPTGAGLSSSAAFEVLAVTMLNAFYNANRVKPVEAAQIAQFAENNYFGKPCGLMDQTTCAVGGLVTIDFKDFDNPVVKSVACDFAASGYVLTIVDTGGSHANLNDDYAALEEEMKSVARALGGSVLREFSEEEVRRNIAGLRPKVGDRAILRALHFHADDQRVVAMVQALEQGDFARFLNLVTESGLSSWMLCQNCYSAGNVREQGISIALAMSEKLLKGKGAWRVHGGGFAGTIQAFVPSGMVDEYAAAMGAVFGTDSCHRLLIRKLGAARVA